MHALVQPSVLEANSHSDGPQRNHHVGHQTWEQTDEEVGLFSMLSPTLSCVRGMSLLMQG